MGFGDVLGNALIFFSEFTKKDFFPKHDLQVLDVSFGCSHTLVLCYDKKTKKNRVFGCGQTDLGQLGKISKLIYHDFIELTDTIEGQVSQISAGSFHSLFLTCDNRVFGCGKNSKGQLGFKPTSTNKIQGVPKEIKFINPAEK